jgi:hypothetical protein
VVPSLAVTEVFHLLADLRRRGSVAYASEFCAAIADDELWVIEATPHDYRRMSELLATYSSARLQWTSADPPRGLTRGAGIRPCAAAWSLRPARDRQPSSFTGAVKVTGQATPVPWSGQ